MSYRFVKRQNAIGWDWYLESGDCSSWVSPLAKEVIETLEAENAKLWELANYTTPIAWYAASEQERERMRELGVEVDG